MFLAIVPAYNEEKTVGSVVRNLFHHVDRVVVVDDGSSDGTGEAARAAGAVVLTHRLNRGQGAALETGHEYARWIGADYVLHFDADGQFDVADIAPALTALKESGAHMLIGSRLLDARSALPWFKRYVLFPLARLFHRVFFGVVLTDVHNGFRILSRRALEAIYLEQDRMAHATEILAQAKNCGLKTIEFPVKVVYREYGQGFGGGPVSSRIFLLWQVYKTLTCLVGFLEI